MANVISTVDVGEHAYEIRGMGAIVGSLVVNKLVGQFQRMVAEAAKSDEPAAEPSGEAPDPAQMVKLLYMGLPENDMALVQQKALACVHRYKKVGDDLVALPVFVNGSFKFPDLDTDIGAVMELTKEALAANVASFFTRDGLAAMFGARPSKDSSR